MREEKIEDVITLSGEVPTKNIEYTEDSVEVLESEEVEEAVIDPKRPEPGKQRRALDTDIVARARSLYITTDMSINAISEQLGVNRHTLARYCQNEKWSLLKQNPDFEDWSLEVVNEIYDKIDFYNDSQKLLHRLLLDENYQTPKDIKMIVEAYRAADERTTALRLLKENGNKANGTDY